MSNTMNIYCDDCKEELWYGQESRGKRYIYEEEGKKGLVEFLEKHEGHRLHCDNDYEGDTSGIDTDEYTKFDDDKEE